MFHDQGYCSTKTRWISLPVQLWAYPIAEFKLETLVLAVF